ncbi:hypothetical protein [Carboxylicivirga caseinilyticus]|uniref:hypothetical protein n=1 Tax=Carboxylicivirga caseinilyticus TaxID=3417572 RepID=UPI003D33F5D1|nr:hypothetical protein [Marinilabiliaceae bacterium A049]
MIEKILKALDFRIEIVEDAFQQAINSSNNNAKGAYLNYHKEVAFFTHFIYTNDIIKLPFRELLAYDKNLFNDKTYRDIISEICSSIREVSNVIINEIGLDNLPEEINDGWKNPFKTELSIQAKDLFLKLIKYDALPKPQETVVLKAIYSILVEIFTRWDYTKPKTNWGNTFALMENYSQQISKLEYLTGFLKEQTEANSALRLFNLYKAINPIGIPNSFNERFFHEIVASGDKLTDDKTYLTDCKKIKEYLQQKILEGFSIDVSIDQFITFMENFRKADEFPEGEKQLQKEFETFLFHKGYFPLSEVQLKNGRLDTLAINGSNSFLVEYKQIGWNKDIDSVKDEINKIVSSFIQTEIYINRLNGLESLQKTIYVILFTKKYFVFNNSINDLYYKGKTFRFQTVYMGETPPSKIKNYEIINLNEMINN